MLNFRFTILTAFALILLPYASSFAETDYPAQIKPIVEQRCMVCHGCYDAPCQLKLDAWTGLQRGASKVKVYDGTRLRTANMTRLFEDAKSTQEWRTKGFYPVLDDADPEQSVMHRMLQLKQQHPLPTDGPLPSSFDFSLDRKQQCAKPDEMDSYASDYPLWGMPYGLPGLNDDEHRQLTQWLGEGSPGVARPAPPGDEIAAIERWESFFNGASLKQQLMARYMYEHLFVGDLYFSDLREKPGYYNLVRSRTPTGQPIDKIATRRPYDPPGQSKFYYRLQPLRTSVLAKRHMPYALNEQRMQRWQALFIEADYEVTSLPSYATDVASNPFIAFQELPVQSRYKFMLDEAQFTIMGFIKGPVCRGQVALNVIDDHFWVAFINPDTKSANHNGEFLAMESKNLRLPVASRSMLLSMVEWRRYSRDQVKYLKAKSKFLNTHPANLSLKTFWDGNGNNDNAALTIFRHNDSASVVKGFVGQQPKTAWVIDYSLLERIHYLLVAGFDVFGNVSHQLETRLYMDFLRMEGEQNFLLFLPKDDRIALRNFWYREASAHVKEFVLGDSAKFDRDSAIVYHTKDPKQELLTTLQQRLNGAKALRYNTSNSHFTHLQTLTGKPFSFMPEVAFVEVLDASGESQMYSIVHNDAYLNNAQIFKEAQRRVLVEDYLTVVNGFIGSYPNVFFQVSEAQLEDFVKEIIGLRSEQDYAQLVSQYGVRRNAPWFWKISDKFNAHYKKHYPVEAGLFDLNRYENR
ncbi:MAG: fatty acid cis/trans isomerase [Halioglobus sp.]